jgi:hypothetical protein
VNLVKQEDVDSFKKRLSKLFAHEVLCGSCKQERERAKKEERIGRGFELCLVHQSMRRKLAKDEEIKGLY